MVSEQKNGKIIEKLRLKKILHLNMFKASDFIFRTIFNIKLKWSINLQEFWIKNNFIIKFSLHSTVTKKAAAKFSEDYSQRQQYTHKHLHNMLLMLISAFLRANINNNNNNNVSSRFRT